MGVPNTYGPPVAPYMSLHNSGSLHPSLEQFPAFNPGLGIQDPSGGIPYDGLANPSMQSVDQQYGSNQGSVSPYNHSPHQSHTGFYNQ